MGAQCPVDHLSLFTGIRILHALREQSLAHLLSFARTKTAATRTLLAERKCDSINTVYMFNDTICSICFGSHTYRCPNVTPFESATWFECNWFRCQLASGFVNCIGTVSTHNRSSSPTVRVAFIPSGRLPNGTLANFARCRIDWFLFGAIVIVHLI